VLSKDSMFTELAAPQSKGNGKKPELATASKI
jgi:hypothetical protein